MGGVRRVADLRRAVEAERGPGRGDQRVGSDPAVTEHRVLACLTEHPVVAVKLVGSVALAGDRTVGGGFHPGAAADLVVLPVGPEEDAVELRLAAFMRVPCRGSYLVAEDDVAAAVALEIVVFRAAVDAVLAVLAEGNVRTGAAGEDVAAEV